MKTTRTLNHSRQREAILAFLKPRKDHPTADMIYRGVKQEFPNISLGTVYRNPVSYTHLTLPTIRLVYK